VEEAGAADRREEGARPRRRGGLRRRDLLGGAAAAAFAGALRPAQAAGGSPAPPTTPRRPARIEQLGRGRVDDYAWLKPANWKAVWRDPSTLDPVIRNYLARETRYCDQVLAPTRPLQARLVAEMRRRTAPDLAAPPIVDGPWAYFVRYAPGAQHPRHLRRSADDGPEQVLVDLEARAKGHAFFAATGAAHSPDQSLFAWAEDTVGAEKYAIFVKNLATGDVIEGPREAFGDFVFSPDSRWLFWTWRDASSRPARIYRRLTRGGPDVLVHEEADPGFLLRVTLSGSRRFILIRAWNDVTSEVWLVDGRAPEAPPRLVEPRTPGHLYSLEHWNDRFVVQTNADGAADFKLMLAPEAAPQRPNWREWTPHRPGRTIIDMLAFADHFVRVERVEGNPTLVVSSAAGEESPVAFEEAAYALSLQPSAYAGHVLDFAYESPRTPKAWMALDLRSGQSRVRARQAVPSGHEPEAYELRRVHARAGDGEAVPVTLLHRRGLKLDGSAPLLLTGYGSYGYSYETGFSIPNLSLVDRGWVWAVAHVRGGSEKGRGWFEQARGLGKKVSFSDFIVCAEHLIAQGYTRAGRIVLHGYSAGGLLTGVAANLRPDLWGAVIGQAPFVDMLNTMSDATHPLVPLTRPVWGDPLSDPQAYDYIASYSPYENIARQPYPPVLATTAVGDDRVGFWEPAKWIAALRARSTSGAPMLLHVELSGGHAGAGGRFEEYAQIARMYGFAIWALETDGRT
jgi:oligopeptidase B